MFAINALSIIYDWGKISIWCFCELIDIYSMHNSARLAVHNENVQQFGLVWTRTELMTLSHNDCNVSQLIELSDFDTNGRNVVNTSG